jgi:hypothetical protein
LVRSPSSATRSLSAASNEIRSNPTLWLQQLDELVEQAPPEIDGIDVKFSVRRTR